MFTCITVVCFFSFYCAVKSDGIVLYACGLLRQHIPLCHRKKYHDAIVHRGDCQPLCRTRHSSESLLLTVKRVDNPTLNRHLLWAPPASINDVAVVDAIAGPCTAVHFGKATCPLREAWDTGMHDPVDPSHVCQAFHHQSYRPVDMISVLR